MFDDDELDDDLDDSLCTLSEDELEDAIRTAEQRGRARERAEIAAMLRMAATLNGSTHAVLGAIEGRNTDGTVSKAWNEESHPRDDHGRFVSAGEIRLASRDPAKADALRASVTDPEQRKKLDSLLSTAKPFGGHERADSAAEALKDVQSTSGYLETHAAEGEQHVRTVRGHLVALIKNATPENWEETKQRITDDAERMQKNAAIHWREAKNKALAQFKADYGETAEADLPTIAEAFDKAETEVVDAYGTLFHKAKRFADWVANNPYSQERSWSEKTNGIRQEFEEAYRAARDTYLSQQAKVWDVVEEYRDWFGGKEQGHKLGRYFKGQWSEDKHPRNHGQFSSTQGAKDDTADVHGHRDDSAHARDVGATATSTPADSDPDAKAQTLAARISEVPTTLATRVRAFIEGRYAKLASRYGETGAKAILGATVLLLPAPIPGSSLLPVAVAEAILRLRRAVTGGVQKAVGEEMDPQHVAALARDLWHELSEEFPDVQGQADAAPVVEKAWNPDEHPRSDDGRFVDAHDLHAALTDPAKAAELRAKVTKPEERRKLDEAIGEEKPKGEAAKPAEAKPISEEEAWANLDAAEVGTPEYAQAQADIIAAKNRKRSTAPPPPPTSPPPSPSPVAPASYGPRTATRENTPFATWQALANKVLDAHYTYEGNALNTAVARQLYESGVTPERAVEEAMTRRGGASQGMLRAHEAMVGSLASAQEPTATPQATAAPPAEEAAKPKSPPPREEKPPKRAKKNKPAPG